MTQFPNFKKFTLMKLSKCCNAEVGVVSNVPIYYKCIHCGQECEVIEQSESTASDSIKEVSAGHGLLAIKEGKVKSFLALYDTGQITFGKMVELLDELAIRYSSQKDAQIQALTKEVEGLHGIIIGQSKRANILVKRCRKLTDMCETMSCRLQDFQQYHTTVNDEDLPHILERSEKAINEWEKLNK